MAEPQQPVTVDDVIKSRPARWTGAAVLLGIGVACLFFNQDVARVTGYTALNGYAADLVDQTLIRDQTTFLVISAIKASVALIEGSAVGVGFELEVGDITQPAYDYIDFFWRAFLYAFLVMGFYKLLLETELLFLGISLIGGGAIFYAAGLLVRVSRYDLLRVGRRFVLIGILIAYVAPLSLVLTNLLSEHYTSHLKDKHAATIRQFGGQVEKAEQQFLALRSEVSILRPTESIEGIRLGLLRVVDSIGQSFRLSLLAFLYYVLLILFDLLFFPLLSAIILYKFTTLALGRILTVPPQPAPAATAKPAAA